MRRLMTIVLLMLLIMPLTIIAQDSTLSYEDSETLKNNLIFMQEQLEKSNSEIIILKAHLLKAKDSEELQETKLQEALNEQRNLKILIEQSKKELKTVCASLETTEQTVIDNKEQFEQNMEELKNNIQSDKNKSFFKGLGIGLTIGGITIVLFCILRN